MTAVDTAKLVRKAEQAAKNVEDCKAQFALLVTDGANANAESFGALANTLAGYEGASRTYARLVNTYEYFVKNGREFTFEVLTDVVSEILLQGADDTWSGRGNDLQRARFEGVRTAARDARYLVL